MTRDGRRPGTEGLLLGLLLFQSASALFGGAMLVLDPSGAALDLSVDLLGGSPFGSYRVPGAILFAVLGVGPCFVAYAVWSGRSWARPGAIMAGVALVTWIGVQLALIGYQPWPPPPWPSLQLVYGAVGLAIFGLAAVGVSALEGDREA